MKTLADLIDENAVLRDRLERVTKEATEYSKFWCCFGPMREARDKLKRALHESWALGVGG